MDGARIAEMLRRHMLRSRLARAATVVSLLLCVLVAHALSRPAITLGEDPVCGMAEHAHTDACYDVDGTLVCTIPEHEHADACYPAEAADEADGVEGVAETESPVENEPSTSAACEPEDAAAPSSGELSAEGDGYVVRIAYDETAALPEGTAVETRELDPTSDEYADHLARALNAAGIPAEDAELYTARFFDITLVADGEVIEPEASVQVSIALDGLSAETDESAGETASDVAAVPDASDVTVVHFADGGIELIDPEPAPDLAAEAGTNAAYTFDQASFSVSGLVVRKILTPASSLRDGTVVAKRRSFTELEQGAQYVIYIVDNGTPYAIGQDGLLHQLSRTTDGNNIYQVDGGAIDSGLVWTLEGRVTGTGQMGYQIRNVADQNCYLYPRTAGQPCVEATGNKPRAWIAPANDNAYNLRIGNAKGSTLYVNVVGTTQTTTSSSAKTVFFAEIPSEFSHTATQVTTTELLEGYYVISRNLNVTASTTGVITVDDALVRANGYYYSTVARGVGTHQIQGFRNSDIWYIKPNGDGTYVVRNVWSGEYLSPTDSGTLTSLRFDSRGGSNVGWAFHITSADSSSGLRHRTTYADWESGGDNYFLYRVDDDGFYHAWFDTGVGGNGGVHGFYRGVTGDFDAHVQYRLDEDNGTSHTLHLPTADDVGTTGSGGSYAYRLNGWYDVYGGQWYAPGSAVTVTGNAVFYADWVAANYDIGQNADLSPNPLANLYSPAITTTLFDYNELFNLPNSTLSTTATDDVSATGHREIWADATPVKPDGIDPASATSFDFVYGGISQGTGLGNVNGRVYQNQSHSTGTGDGNYNGNVTAGILTYNPYIASRLFDPSVAAIGKTYVGADHYLYSYDARTGYYYYDSNRNAASYNQSAGRFYVYNYTNLTDKSTYRTSDSTWADNTDFLPFNYGSRTFTEGAGEVDYWFGMKTEFYFFLPNDASTAGGINKSIMGDDLAFRFSGDDDVWVLVDDQLVLDLGGIHGTVYGEVNFSDCTVTVGQGGAAATYELINGTTVATSSAASVIDENKRIIGVTGTDGVTTTTSSFLDSLSAGNHKLTLLYLERGSSESNAAIYFNIAPVYQLRLAKVDGTRGDGTLVDGATFEVYTDEACTQKATNLHPYTYGSYATTYDSSRGYVGTGGCFYLDGLVANQDYYLKEVETPAGYRPLSGPIRLRISGTTMTGTYLPTDADGKTSEVVLFTQELEAQGSTFSGVYGGFAIEVPNYTGREIPSTGGPGTAGLTAVGALLVVAALAGLRVRRGSGSARRGSRGLVAVLALVLALSTPLAATRSALAAQTGSVRVNFAAEGMPFALYRVGDVTRADDAVGNAALAFTPTDEVAAWGLDWGGLTSDNLYDDLAQALAAAIAAEGADPVAKGETSGGYLRFPDVEEGLYLVVGGSVEYEGHTWSATPTLLAVPDLMGDGGWDVEVTPKQSRVPLGSDTVEYVLVKQWVGDNADVRPASIEVVLSKGGVVQRTVTLSAENNWSYSWEDVDDGVPWTAAEANVPEDYTWTVATEGARITLRNTYAGTPPPPDEPMTPDTPSGPDAPATPRDPLSQTGDLSMPSETLGLLAVAGVLTLLAGVAVRRLGRLLRRVFVAAGLAVVLGAGLSFWQALQVEEGRSDALQAAAEDLAVLVPARAEVASPDTSASESSPLPVMAIDGIDLVGYLRFIGDEGGESLVAVPSAATEGDPRNGVGTLAVGELDDDLAHAGTRFAFVDVDGIAHSYVIDHVLGEGESTDDALVLSLEGQTTDLSLVCHPVF